jgi:hypothetical protein
LLEIGKSGLEFDDAGTSLATNISQSFGFSVATTASIAPLLGIGEVSSVGIPPIGALSSEWIGKM